MRLQKVQEALNTKKIPFEYTEEDGCGSIDFMFRGLKFHVWEYEDSVWGAETNVFAAGRSEDVEHCKVILFLVLSNIFSGNLLYSEAHSLW